MPGVTKLDRCVQDVMQQGHDKSSAYAICNASMNKSKKDKKKSLYVPFADVLKDVMLENSGWDTVEVEHDEPKGTIIAIPVPMHVAEAISVDGGECPTEMHITLAYIDGVEGDALDRLQMEVEEGARCFEPFMVSIGGVGRFLHEDEDVIYASIDSAALDDFRTNLVQHHVPFDIYVSKEHGWTPHITIQYVSKEAPTPRPSADIQRSWLVEHVEVWHKNMRYSYPLSREDWEPIF